MAYLHCHSCDWSQDDFYTKRYNPLTKIWDDTKWLFQPRIITLDCDVDHLIKYTHVPVLRWQGHGGKSMFSWNWLIVEMVRDIKSALRMKWWTWDSWKDDWNNHREKCKCPKCGKCNFDID